MKLTKIATAALVPAAIAGVTLSGWAAVQAATDHPGSHVQAHHAAQAGQHRTGQRKAEPKQHRTAREVASTAKASAAKAQAAQRARAQADHRARAHAASHPAAKPAASSPTSWKAGMSAFEQCVAWRESGDNPTASSSGLFGILPSTWASLGYPGTAGQASVALQKAAFSRLYAQYGTQPWAPYDGC
jgi:hypothetical protein